MEVEGGGRSASGHVLAGAASIFLVYLGFVIVNPSIAPLSRGIGLAEWQIGFVVSVSALAMVATSTGWGRRGGIWGRRRTLLVALASATSASLVFALLAQLAFTAGMEPLVLFITLLFVRGLWFGLSEAAVLPNVQAHIAERTPEPSSRVKGMAALGAAQGAALVLGSGLGGIVAAAGVLTPLWCTPALIAAAGVLIAVSFRRTGLVGESGQEQAGARVRLMDARVLPFLVITFSAFFALGFVQILIGFLTQDRLGSGAEATALLSGIAFVCAGAGLVIAQALIVPHVGWGPSRLIRTGLVIAFIGFTAFVPDWGLWGLLAGMLLTGLGLGLMGPGVTAGASLAVSHDEQGAVAGLITAANALTLVTAPLCGTILYEIHQVLPFMVAAAIAAFALVLALRHPALRAQSA